MTNPDTFDLSNYLKEHQNLVNTYIKKILTTFDHQRELIQASRHSLMAGGKRLRPILCLSAAYATGGNHLCALPSSCALEFIHTYSLIHDDLPAMDDDELRRGKPTCHVQFSESTAILAGDALLTHAFHILSNPALYFSHFPKADQLLEIIALISDAAGINGMVEGQMLDIQGHQDIKSPLLDHTKQIHYLKTGRLIEASVMAGALSVEADQDRINALQQYAVNIGLAFQVTDDILNVEGDQEIMGKTVGSDKELDKLTFPSLVGLEKSKQFAAQLVNDSLKALSPFDGKAEPLRQIARYIITRNH